MAVPTAPLDGVYNFRSFDAYATASGRTIRAGCVFRSANLHSASANDVSFLCESALCIGGGSSATANAGTGLRTIVDLRSRDEQRKDILHADASKHGALVKQFTIIDARSDASVDAVSARSTAASASNRTLMPIPLVASDDLFKCVFALASWWRRIAFFLLACCRGPRKAFEIVLYSVFCTQMRLEHFYRFLLSNANCQKRICHVLKTCADRAHYPLVFHCTHGKDRTGIIAALILLTLGVDEADIVRDYAATEHVVPYEERARSLAPGMDASIWAGTPAPAMRASRRDASRSSMTSAGLLPRSRT
jgi:hypothetical protein